MGGGRGGSRLEIEKRWCVGTGKKKNTTKEVAAGLDEKKMRQSKGKGRRGVLVGQEGGEGLKGGSLIEVIGGSAEE